MSNEWDLKVIFRDEENSSTIPFYMLPNFVEALEGAIGQVMMDPGQSADVRLVLVGSPRAGSIELLFLVSAVSATLGNTTILKWLAEQKLELGDIVDSLTLAQWAAKLLAAPWGLFAKAGRKIDEKAPAPMPAEAKMAELVENLAHTHLGLIHIVRIAGDATGKYSIELSFRGMEPVELLADVPILVDDDIDYARGYAAARGYRLEAEHHSDGDVTITLIDDSGNPPLVRRNDRQALLAPRQCSYFVADMIREAGENT